MRNRFGFLSLGRIFLALSLAALATPAGAQLPDPVSWWPLDEGTGTVAGDVVDSNDGTITGAAWAPGMLGNSLDFDGNDDDIAIPSSPSL